ncbi:hypothetical protein NQ315_001365 [Exocentrus adspersus]|uniref:Uncharacterized protein n=1 Tax=Exocentrus adspersus TaxID=1586481 RepID=A0AAV8WEL9_9CUCU|nr:hypothetical protein NQ315_001365 [Exocentrus adspersus]
MVHRAFLVVLVVFCAVANGQNCVPRSVSDMHLSQNGTLSWSVSPQETCTISHFTVNLRRSGADEQEFTTNATSVDVSNHIPFCQFWQFRVTAVSVDSTAGSTHLLLAKRVLPDVSLIATTYLNITSGEGHLLLAWDTNDDEYRSCADSFRVTVYDEDNGILSDHYRTERYLSLDYLSYCVTYQFEVRAINNDFPSEEGPSRLQVFEMPRAVQLAPRLRSVSTGATWANTTWILENIDQNGCPIRMLYVDGGNYFNISLPIVDEPTLGSVERDPVELNLQSLKPSSMYLLKVSVENSAGASIPAVVGVQTTDLAPGKV